MGTSLDSLEPNLRVRFQQAQGDPRLKAVRGGIVATSTCRSQAEQQRLWNLYITGRGPLAARVGTSPHQVGSAPWRDNYCHAVDIGFRAGNPPGGYPKRSFLFRDKDWRLLETVLREYGMSPTVPKEEWHYQSAGTAKPVIPPLKSVPNWEKALQMNEKQADEMYVWVREIRGYLGSQPGVATRVEDLHVQLLSYNSTWWDRFRQAVTRIVK